MKKITVCFLGLFAGTSHATNGINLIGFGAESTLMAGADIAVARDTTALNTNPAGLTQIKTKRFDAYGSLLRITDLSHEDQFGNDRHASNLYTGLGGMGYAQKLENVACTVGGGLFAQGGSGGVFENMQTAFATEDEYSGLFAVGKLTGGVGCEVNNKWSVGGSFGLVYAQAEQKIFPDTSAPPAFAGIEIDDATSLRTSFKLGIQYRATPKLTLAASYTGKTELPLTDGELKLNMTGAGLGVVKYDDVSLKGLALPEEIGVGAAYQMNEKLLLSLKVNWLNWSDAMKKTELRATDPSVAGLPDINSTSTMNWNNQLVFATGMAYRYNDKLTLYSGYNYGKNPIPKEHTNPVVAGIFDHHLTFGGSYQYNSEWIIYGGIEYDFRKKVDYTNSELPFGNDSQLRNEAVWMHMMVSRQW
jgi:long-chain fatty acid transport protein